MCRLFRNRKLILKKLEFYIDKRNSLLVYSQYLGIGFKHNSFDEYERLDRCIKRLWKLYYK